jgi:hypothetical protein
MDYACCLAHCRGIGGCKDRLGSTPGCVEQLGERLKRRYDRQLQRRGLAPPGNARAEAELDRILGEV